MLFLPKLAAAVIDGSKTNTRRIVRDGDRAVNIVIEYLPKRWRYEKAVHRGNRVLWETGRTYAVQPGRGKKALGRLLLKDMRRERLQYITAGGVRAEGIRRGFAIGGEWLGWHMPYVQGQHTFINPKWLKRTPEVKVVRRGARAVFACLWDSINKTRGTRWSDNPEVWVLVFKRVEA